MTATSIPPDGIQAAIESADAFIFDCDGTLADTMPLHRQAWHRAFEDEGLTCPNEFLLPFGGLPSRVIVQRYNQAFSADLDPDAFSAGKQRIVRDLLTSAERIEPVTRIAETHHGRIRMAVASGGTRHNVDLILDAIRLRHLFDVVITADDAVAAKPAPDIFLVAAQRLDTPPARCLVFEDGPAGFEAAASAGIPVIDVEHLVAQGKPGDSVAARMRTEDTRTR